MPIAAGLLCTGLVVGIARGEDAPSAKATAADSRRMLTHPVAAQRIQNERPDPDEHGLLRVKAEIQHHYKKRLVDRVSVPLESLSAYHMANTPGQQLLDHALYDQMNDQVKQGVERQTRKAVKAYLIDMTQVDRLIDTIKRSRGRGPSDGDSGAAPSIDDKRLHFDLRFSHARPKVKMTYDLGTMSQVGVSVGMRGDVGFEFRDARMSNTSVQGGRNADGEYYLACGISF